VNENDVVCGGQAIASSLALERKYQDEWATRVFLKVAEHMVFIVVASLTSPALQGSMRDIMSVERLAHNGLQPLPTERRRSPSLMDLLLVCGECARPRR
jgi:hypothetical protein